MGAFMDNYKIDIIKKIAQELDCGNNCYYNLKTDEIVAIPNFSDSIDAEEFKDLFKSEIKKVENENSNFIKIKALENFETFKIIEQFVKQITDLEFRTVLEVILENQKPFQNFKNSIDHSNYRQDWFDFKQEYLEKLVKTKLTVH
ncbi:UPF0158 family protein [Bacteroidota bacterium]